MRERGPQTQKAGLGETLSSRVAVVTGASKGIGAAIAEALAAEGCRLVLAARSADRLEEMAEELRARYRVEVLSVPTDISDERQARSLIETAAAHFGCVDILINNAGMGIYGAIDELNLDDLRHVFEVNFFGPLAALQEAVVLMRRQGGGNDCQRQQYRWQVSPTTRRRLHGDKVRAARGERRGTRGAKAGPYRSCACLPRTDRDRVFAE